MAGILAMMKAASPQQCEVERTRAATGFQSAIVSFASQTPGTHGQVLDSALNRSMMSAIQRGLPLMITVLPEPISPASSPNAASLFGFHS